MIDVIEAKSTDFSHGIWGQVSNHPSSFTPPLPIFVHSCKLSFTFRDLRIEVVATFSVLVSTAR